MFFLCFDLKEEEEQEEEMPAIVEVNIPQEVEEVPDIPILCRLAWLVAKKSNTKNEVVELL